jgi:hypothetical protein
MTRVWIAAALTVGVLAVSTHTLKADVRADEKSRVEFAGALGKVVNFFGGKSAREGVQMNVAVKGSRKSTMSEGTGQIIDLSEEKVYDLDLKKKTYTVTTFAELRRRMEEEQKKAAENARREQAKPEEKPTKEVEIDFNVKNTGQTKTINGFNTSEAIMTIVIREKGKTLEQSGGMVLTSDMWMAPRIAAMREIAEFDQRYAQQLALQTVAGASAEQMAAALAMYPNLSQALQKMRAEGVKLDGTPILTTVTIEAAKSAEQMQQEGQQKQEQQPSGASGGVSGMLGGFAKRVTQKKQSDEPPSSRASIMTTTTEVLKVTTDVAAADVAVPADFKEKR